MPSTNRVPPDLFGNQTAWSEPVDYILLDQQELDSLVRPAQRPPADLQEFADDAGVYDALGRTPEEAGYRRVIQASDSLRSRTVLNMSHWLDRTPARVVDEVTGAHEVNFFIVMKDVQWRIRR